jgi:caspase domain-containing protein
MGLGQLTTAPPSARLFADWAIRGATLPVVSEPLGPLHNPSAPLGSVWLLLSPSTPYTLPDGSQRPVPEATWPNFRAAFREWYDRCNTDPGNVAVFYFCGHGIARGVAGGMEFLLLEDFGEDEDSPFDGAVEIAPTRRSLDLCQAGSQFWFLDACRNTPVDIQAAEFPRGRVPIANSALTLMTPSRPGLVFYSTSPNTRAHGLENTPTPFTQALVWALSSLGSDHVNGEWQVTTDTLGRAVRRLMARRDLFGRGLPTQDPQPQPLGGAERAIHVLTDLPKVPVFITCSPEEASDLASLAILEGAVERTSRGRQPGQWQVQLPWGRYLVRATFDANNPGGFQDQDKLLDVDTPLTEMKLEVV